MYKLRNTIPLFFTSDASTKTVIVDKEGSRCRYHLSQPIELPLDTNNYFRVLKSTMWYVNPNVSAALGNNVWEFNNGGLISYTLADGLYSLRDLQERLSELFVNSGLASDYMVIQGDEATNKVSLQINAAGVSIDWANSTLGSILGFTTNIVASVDGAWVESDNIAALNIDSEYQIHTNFTSGAYNNRNYGSSICGVIHINTAPGSQIITEDRYPTQCRVNGRLIDEIELYITNQTGRLGTVNMRNEIFTVSCEILVYDK